MEKSLNKRFWWGTNAYPNITNVSKAHNLSAVDVHLVLKYQLFWKMSHFICRLLVLWSNKNSSGILAWQKSLLKVLTLWLSLFTFALYNGLILNTDFMTECFPEMCFSSLNFLCQKFTHCSNLLTVFYLYAHSTGDSHGSFKALSYSKWNMIRSVWEERMMVPNVVLGKYSGFFSPPSYTDDAAKLRLLDLSLWQ